MMIIIRCVSLNALSTKLFSSSRSFDPAQFVLELVLPERCPSSNVKIIKKSPGVCILLYHACIIDVLTAIQAVTSNPILLFTCKSATNNANISSFMAEDIYQAVSTCEASSPCGFIIQLCQEPSQHVSLIMVCFVVTRSKLQQRRSCGRKRKVLFTNVVTINKTA